MHNLACSVSLLPDSPDDRHLQRQVRPTSWSARPSQDIYDLVVVGGGTAGLVAASGAAVFGAKVALIEQSYLGGDCLVTGCVPSKTLIAAARAAHAIKRAAQFGIQANLVEFNFAAVMERIRRVRSEVARHDSAKSKQERGIDVLFGEARFTGPRNLKLDGEDIRFRKAVICSGGRPNIPDVSGLKEYGLTSESFFNLTDRPSRLVIVGGGPMGCEIAQAMNRLGSHVTLLEKGNRLLPKDDPDVSRLIAEILSEEGVHVRTDSEPLQVLRESDGLRVLITSQPQGHTEVLLADALLIATGRHANTSHLNLEMAGVDYDAHGVKVDHRQRTSNPRIYAAGDVCSAFQFTHTAHAQAEYACMNALFPFRLNSQRRAVCWTTFTDPEVAHAGLAWQEIEKSPEKYQSWTFPFSKNDRAEIEGQSQGFARVHCRRGTDRVIAATIVAPHAGEMIALLSAAITNGWRLREFQKTIFPYPTWSDAVRQTAVQWRASTLTPTVRAMLGYWIRWSRWWN